MYKTIQTITTIELANVCNLSCRYCINRLLIKDPARKTGIMADDTFDWSLELLKTLVKRNTQQEVNLNGNGESCLDPQLPQRIRKVKDVIGNKSMIAFCTNGVNMTKVLAHKIKDAGIDRVDISIHDIFHARKCADIFVDVGLIGIFAMGALLLAHDWAGQLEIENRAANRLDSKCDPIIEGRAYIQMEGNITPCCYDFRNLGVFGSVFDDDILQREVKPYVLCKTCHQKIPEEILKAA